MRVLMIHAHPRADSYSAALREATLAALEAAGHEVELRDLYAEGFVATLSAAEHAVNGIAGANEAGIEDHVAALRCAEALVLVYPTWWGAMPALLKGFFDRVLLPGYAYRYRRDSPWWDKLLAGRSARATGCTRSTSRRSRRSPSISSAT